METIGKKKEVDDIEDEDDSFDRSFLSMRMNFQTHSWQLRNLETQLSETRKSLYSNKAQQEETIEKYNKDPKNIELITKILSVGSCITYNENRIAEYEAKIHRYEKKLNKWARMLNHPLSVELEKMGYELPHSI